MGATFQKDAYLNYSKEFHLPKLKERRIEF
jgi:hypothetical protein